MTQWLLSLRIKLAWLWWTLRGKQLPLALMTVVDGELTANTLTDRTPVDPLYWRGYQFVIHEVYLRKNGMEHFQDLLYSYGFIATHMKHGLTDLYTFRVFPAKVE